jgi:hypothetical protein
MSKQSDQKLAQGYIPKTTHMCSHCKFFKSERVKKKYLSHEWTHETNLRCGLGGFKVMKTGTCNAWTGK